MPIVQQSSKAQDQSLAEWFQAIEQAQIKLPRFQRYEEWDRSRITSFLNSIIHNLPVGITLVLNVAGKEPFVSRYISTAEPGKPSMVMRHLLDGQQRLTAFWRAMHNNYEGETYFVYLPQYDQWAKEDAKETEPSVYCEPRWVRKDKRVAPLWADEPAGCFERGLIPISLLCPGDRMKDVDAWIASATRALEPKEDDPDGFRKLKQYGALKDELKGVIVGLRERVAHFNLPFLALPAVTDKETALQVFININTNSKPLSLYDLLVAEMENAVGQSLHEMQDELEDRYPSVPRYFDLSYLILATSALLQDSPPNNRGMAQMSMSTMVENWAKMERCLGKMAEFFAAQGVYDEARLPTNAVLGVVAACYELIPDDGDYRAKAERLLKRYLWSSFFTERYQNSAATRAYADYKALKALLAKPGFKDAELSSVPVLDRTEYPLVTAEALVKLRWPKSIGIQERAVLAVTTYLGAVDFADGQRASYESLMHREYHHLFPDALLAEAGIDGWTALNCALITWKTNRHIGRKDPLEYLKDRVAWSDEVTIRERLRTHLISYDDLAKTYAGLTGDALRTKLQAEFAAFGYKRAQLVEKAASRLAAGETVTVESLMSLPQ